MAQFLTLVFTTSEDSRHFGPVDAGQIIGRVVPLPGQRLDPPSYGVEISFPAAAPSADVAVQPGAGSPQS